MNRYWDGSDVYYGDDHDRDAYEATHSSGFHIERSDDDFDDIDEAEEME